MSVASAVVTRPFPDTSPHWQRFPMPSAEAAAPTPPMSAWLMSGWYLQLSRQAVVLPPVHVAVTTGGEAEHAPTMQVIDIE